MIDATTNVTTLRRSARASKPVLQWTPQQNAPPTPKRIKKSPPVPPQPDVIPVPTINNNNTSNTVSTPRPPPTPPAPCPRLSKLPTEILQSIISFACIQHPNNLLRLMGVCSSFNQNIKSHPLWRHFIIKWKLKYTEPKRFGRDYHKKWRHDVIIRAKKICEQCRCSDSSAFKMGRHESDTYRVRLCDDCFSDGFQAFKNRHGKKRQYTMYAKETMIQKESLACIGKCGKALLQKNIGFEVTSHRGKYTYSTYHYPKNQVFMLSDYMSLVEYEF
ncbi:hypothetical protein BDR26DRAFT_871126 [Obelidium mucronatum]|nr:hypothetical protein BDR26DRAFT_871126 [Obelidium mucronatum]